MFNIHNVIAKNLPEYNTGIKLTETDRARLEEKATLINKDAMGTLYKGVTQTYNPTIATSYVAKVKDCPYPKPNHNSELGMIFQPSGIANLNFNASKIAPITGYAISAIAPKLPTISLPSTMDVKKPPSITQNIVSNVTHALSPYDSAASSIAKAAMAATQTVINTAKVRTKEIPIDTRKLGVVPTITGVKNNDSAGITGEVKEGMMYTMTPGHELVDVENERKVDLMKFVPIALLLWKMM